MSVFNKWKSKVVKRMQILFTEFNLNNRFKTKYFMIIPAVYIEQGTNCNVWRHPKREEEQRD